jgi:hypothetical protein
MQQTVDINRQSKTLLLKTKETPEEHLQRLISEHKGKFATTFEELLGRETGQTPEEIKAEVDDFLQMREEWRKAEQERDIDL